MQTMKAIVLTRYGSPDNLEVHQFPIPVIPLVYAWDGRASLVRMYTFDDLRQLLPAAEPGAFTREMGPAKSTDGKQ